MPHQLQSNFHQFAIVGRATHTIPFTLFWEGGSVATRQDPIHTHFGWRLAISFFPHNLHLVGPIRRSTTRRDDRKHCSVVTPIGPCGYCNRSITLFLPSQAGRLWLLVRNLDFSARRSLTLCSCDRRVIRHASSINKSTRRTTLMYGQAWRGTFVRRAGRHEMLPRGQSIHAHPRTVQRYTKGHQEQIGIAPRWDPLDRTTSRSLFPAITLCFSATCELSGSP